ncbi:radical SAM family heme chaperone HemW [uncultured Fibrobacter sp.]|uniref:radical SAM family heme chaperone HemW n=1 Tax=uncultured Fibrobacter sp. TaxID=261512 RepID=UPI002635A16F|nr:radical SAM family heme chaperone HemW [uncultured Fibrobacter sp.]
MFCVYLHIPFCQKICDYCDFRVMPVQPRIYKEFVSFLCKQIVCLERKNPGLLATAQTLYLGGGTPSVLPAEYLREIFGCLASVGVNVHKLTEISMEFNPESTNEASVEAALELGVNRISLGLQTFDAELLKLVGRSHSVEAGIRALNLLTSRRGLQVNADLMFDLPTQKVQGFLDDVDRLSDFPLNHVSFYGLNVSPRSRLGHRVSRGELAIDEDIYEPMYLGGVEILERKGLKRYEVSNFAREGFESVHNQNYWNCGEYAGFGPGAHSFVGGVRYYAPEIYPRWRDYVSAGCPSEMLEVDVLNRESKIMELLWLSLRQSRGLSFADLEAMGVRDAEKLAGHCIDKWLGKNFVVKSDGSIRLSGRGWIFMDDIVTDLSNVYSNLE